MKLSGLDKDISTYKTYISEFQFQWREFRSILRPEHYKATGKCSNVIFSESTSRYVLPISRYPYIWALSMIYMQFWPNDLSFWSFEVIWGQIHFLPPTSDRIEIERWEWAQSVSFAKAHRMVCNMTNLAQHGPWPDVKFWNGLFRSLCTYFDAFRREQYDAAKIMSLAFLVQKLFVNRFCKKVLFWPFLTSTYTLTPLK